MALISFIGAAGFDCRTPLGVLCTGVCGKLNKLWQFKCLNKYNSIKTGFFEHLNFSDGAGNFRGFGEHPKASISEVYSKGTPPYHRGKEGPRL